MSYTTHVYDIIDDMTVEHCQIVSQYHTKSVSHNMRHIKEAPGRQRRGTGGSPILRYYVSTNPIYEKFKKGV